MTVVVYKLGGSLLTLPGFEQRLERLLASRPEDERPLVVVGGGAAADVVREWDRLQG
ncbi:MAG: hypothetical protein KY476_09345 [Planctomycetes bacterium]|nr:hypothetical protein [Planctomycetota bacterium]